MPSALPTPCARCSRPLRPEFRFCPECAYPRTDAGVLSTQIQEVRTRVTERSRPAFGRLVLPGIWAVIAVFVATAGWFVFDPRAAAHVLDPALPTNDGVGGATVRRSIRARILQPEWIDIPVGAMTAGSPQDDFYAQIPAFAIARHETTNEAWLQFLIDQEQSLRDREMWEEAFPGLGIAGWSLDEDGHPLLDPAQHALPVRNISGAAAMLYANWMTRELDIPGVRIRLPHEGEWEFAARGNADQWRVFPWGRRFWADPEPGTGYVSRNARIGIDANSPIVVDGVIDDVSGFGLMGMGSNVSEWVLQAARESLLKEEQRFAPPELRPGEARESATGDAMFRFVLPSLEGGFIPRVMNIRGASFWDEISEPGPFELTPLEEQDLDLRGVPASERAAYTMSPVELWVHHKDAWLRQEEREQALGLQLDTLADDLARARASLPSGDRYLAPSPERARLQAAIEQLEQQRLDVLFLRARTRERLMDWRGASEDYKEWLRLSNAQFERPEDDDMTRLVRHSRRIMLGNAETRRRALVWEQRTVDSSQRFVYTGFRLVRFSLPTR